MRYLLLLSAFLLLADVTAAEEVELKPDVEEQFENISDPCSVPENQAACTQNKADSEFNKTLYEEFQLTKDASLCERIKGEAALKENCRDMARLYFAVTAQNDVSCWEIDNEGLKQNCSELIKQSLEDPGFVLEFPPFKDTPFYRGNRPEPFMPELPERHDAD